MCDRQACANPGTMTPILNVGAKGYPASTPKARMEVGLKICAKCAATATVDDYVTDETWLKIESGFRHLGRAAPDRDTMTVEHVPFQ